MWGPKYHYRILIGLVDQEVEKCIFAFAERLGAEIVELNVQEDHVHLLAMVPPKISISEFMGTVKGRTAIRVFNKFRHLKPRPYWGNHFWARGYCVDTIGLDAEKIRKYVKYQEERQGLASSGGKVFHAPLGLVLKATGSAGGFFTEPPRRKERGEKYLRNESRFFRNDRVSLCCWMPACFHVLTDLLERPLSELCASAVNHPS